MSMVIQQNITALNSHRQLGINNSKVKQSLEKLSSGYRINTAADDAAGLAISEKMRAQITGLERATKNALDGISLVQTAEGALGEVHSMLNRMVELAVESANGVLGDDDRLKIEAEITAIKDEVDRISQATNFNGIKLIDGSLDKVWRAVTKTYPSGKINEATLPPGDILDPYVKTSGGALDSMPDLFKNQGVGPVTISATPDSMPTHLTFTIAGRNGGELSYSIEMAGVLDMNNGSTYTLDLSPFGSLDIENIGNGMQYVPEWLVVTDLADYLQNRMTPGLSVDPSEIHVTQMQQVDIDGLILQVGDTADDYNKVYVKVADMSSNGLGITKVTMISQQTSSVSLKNINSAIEKVSVSRGKLGAIQNRLETTVENLEVSTENITASESRIRDADMAKEAMHLQKNDILTQSAQSMLAQANMQPQQVLQLLQ